MLILIFFMGKAGRGKLNWTYVCRVPSPSIILLMTWQANRTFRDRPSHCALLMFVKLEVVEKGA